MTIQGYQFDKCKVTPEADAALYYELNNKQNHVIAGYKNEMNVTSSGLNVYVDTGCALVMGRYCEITDQEQLSVMANTEGYVCITIDLTETNIAEGVPGSADYVVTNNQLRVELVTELVQQDLFNDGQVYTFPLAKVVANGTGVKITVITDSYNQSLTEEKVLYEDFSGNGSFFADNVTVPIDNTKELVEFRIIWSRWISGTGALANGGYETRISGSTVREFQRLNFAYRENFQYGTKIGEQCYKNLIFRSTSVQGHIDNNTTPSGGNDNRNIVMRKCVAVYKR